MVGAWSLVVSSSFCTLMTGLYMNGLGSRDGADDITIDDAQRSAEAYGMADGRHAAEATADDAETCIFSMNLG